MFESKTDGPQKPQNPQSVQNAQIPQASQPTSAPTNVPVSESEQIQLSIIHYLYSQLFPDSPTDPAAEHISVFKALRDGRVTSSDEVAFLRTIPATFEKHNLEAIFDQISTHPYQHQILAVIAGYDITNWHDLTVKDLKKFLSAPRRDQPDYRTPVAFAELRRRFLIEIRPQATKSQLTDYIKAMNSLEYNIYGDRYKYYRQFELLRREAHTRAENIDSVSSLPSLLDPVTPTLAERTPITNVTKIPDATITTISEERRDQILNHAIIEGDAWRQAGQDYRLNVPSLINSGLVPYFSAAIDGKTIYFSHLFTLTSGQSAVLAYVASPNGLKVRSYYRDKTLGLWHYLPDYIRDLSGEGIEVFGVGFHEKSTILPILLQNSLNQIDATNTSLSLTNTNPDFLFAGTAPAYNTRQEFRDAYSKGLLRGDFYREVSSTAYNADSGALIAPNRHKIAPQLISVSADTAPNFQSTLAKYQIPTALAGACRAVAFPALDKQTSWLFYSDSEHRCWIPNIETNSPLTSTGCRREWLLPTDIATPLYETSILADGYGDNRDTRPGNLLSMWPNYLSKIPLLEQFSKLFS